MAQRRNWSATEVRAALALYLRTNFGRFHKTNPDVITLAHQLGRTPSAVALKLGNLAALDDTLPQKGMANASATDRAVWAEFLANPDPVIAADQHLAGVYPPPPPQHYGPGWREGRDRQVNATARDGQSFFRRMILTSYQGRCAMTGICDPALLTASHIVGWADDPGNRMNPRNGLCLNALHDRAFVRHLISFDSTHRIVVSARLGDRARDVLMQGHDRLETPERFLPDPSLMARHHAQFLERQG